MRSNKTTTSTRLRRRVSALLAVLMSLCLLGALSGLSSNAASAPSGQAVVAAPPIQAVAHQAQLPAVAGSAQNAATAAASLQTAAPGTCAFFVTVKSGDLLGNLVAANGRPGEWAAVAREGNFNPHIIKPGQQICMRWNGAPPAAAPAPQAPAEPAPQQATPASGWVHPLGKSMVCSSRYGVSRSIPGVSSAPHSGTDLPAKTGTPIHSVASGVVLPATGPASGYGQVIVIKHDDGTIAEYGHVNTIGVRDGQRVNANDVIGTVGSKGQSTGPHLHLTFTKVAAFNKANRMSPEKTLASHGVRLCASGKD